MENLLTNELIKNAGDIQKYTSDLGPSYNEAMKRALETFKSTGIPTKKHEDWIYTNISKTLAPRFFNRASEIVQDVPEEVIDQNARIIFNNGIYNPFQSVLPPGIEVDQLVPQTEFFDSFDALNFSTSMSPISIKITKNTVIDTPISIVHLVDEAGVNKILSPRISIKAEKFSKTSFVEIFSSTQPLLFQYTTNAATIFNIEDSAQVEHVKLLSESIQSTHVGLVKAVLARSSVFKSMTLDYGILTSRHNIDAVINGEGAEAHVNGLYVLAKSEHADVFSSIRHTVGQNQSEQLFKGILAGSSHGAFTGKIVISEDAQLVNSNQLNNNLMLTKKAHIDTRPQLLVSADDVKCAHGATIGQLSSDEAFYLQTRGISKEKAQKMLCVGFAADVLYRIDNNKIRNVAMKKLEQKFASLTLEEISL